MVSVTLEGVMRVFKDGTRVGPIDLMVRDGTFMTLLGPSGAGKTTTLRLIAGFIRPQQGRILFDDRDVTDVPPRERNIGMVFQSVALFPNMNVFENIAFGPEMAGWDSEEVVRRVGELADLLGIRHLLGRRTDEISGGEAQRVALARALAREPGLLLLDEPLSALDPQLRTRLQQEIRRTQRALGITTIYVTHSQEEAFAISDEVAVLHQGTVRQVGTPEELYWRPADTFVARFVGGGSILQAEVVGSDAGTVVLSVGGARLSLPGSHSVGSKVVLTVKPEDVVLGPPADDESLVSGRVVTVVPGLGNHRVTVDTSAGEVTVTVPTSRSGSHATYRPGDRVSLRLSPESVVLLKDAGQPDAAASS